MAVRCIAVATLLVLLFPPWNKTLAVLRSTTPPTTDNAGRGFLFLPPQGEIGGFLTGYHLAFDRLVVELAAIALIGGCVVWVLGRRRGC